jgi:hypothetical protein
MSFARRLSTTVTTASDGSVTAYVDVDYGQLSQIRYVKPRQATHGVDGVAALYAAGGAAVADKIAIVSDRIKIAITNGGSGGVGTFHFVLV